MLVRRERSGDRYFNPRADGAGTNSPRLFTPGEREALAKSSEEQVGNLSAHALYFARFKRKRLGASKYSNLIFERFICVFGLVFSANQKIVNPLHCWEHEEGIRTFTG
jgi:hypothetical protein